MWTFSTACSFNVADCATAFVPWIRCLGQFSYFLFFFFSSTVLATFPSDHVCIESRYTRRRTREISKWHFFFGTFSMNFHRQRYSNLFFVVSTMDRTRLARGLLPESNINGIIYIDQFFYFRRHLLEPPSDMSVNIISATKPNFTVIRIIFASQLNNGGVKMNIRIPKYNAAYNRLYLNRF